MRAHPAALAAILATGVAMAQPAPRWTTGFNQGVVEAMVRAPDGSYVAFSCGAGPSSSPALSVQQRGSAPPGRVTLWLLVDGQSHALSLQDGFITGRPADAIIRAAADALVESQVAGFTAEIAEAGWRQEFPLAGARAALAPEGRSILDGCRG